MAFLAGLLGPLIGGLFANHGGGVAGASAALEATQESDEISQMSTSTALSHRMTTMTNLVDTRNEANQETAMYDEYLVAVQGAQQHIVQKQEQLIDQSTQG